MSFTGTPTTVGRKAKTYLNTGSHASPVWVQIKRTPGLKAMLGKKAAELDVRESDWAKKLAGNKELKFSLDYHKPKGMTDVVYDALLDSYWNDTPLEIATCDGVITVAGTSGWKAYVLAFKFDKDEETNKAITYAVELELTEYVEADALIEPSLIAIS